MPAVRAGAEADLAARLVRLPFTRYHLRVTIILVLACAFGIFDLSGLHPLLTAVRGTFHLSVVQVGWAGAVTISAAVLGGPPTVRIVQRLAPKRALVGSLVTYGALSAASGLAWDYPSLLLLRALLGIGVGAFIHVLATTIRATKGTRYHRPLVALALIAPAFGLIGSSALGPAFLSAFPGETGWRLTLLVGGSPILLGLLAQVTLPESPLWLAAHGRPAEAERIVRGLEEAILQRGGHLEEPQPTLPAGLEVTGRVGRRPRLFLRRIGAVVLLATTSLLTYSVYFK